MTPEVEAKLAKLSSRLKMLGSALVCYSGGVDSAFLLAIAARELGDRAVGMLAVSPSLAPGELEHARDVASRMGATFRVVTTNEIEDPSYVANGPDRCFFCKSELFRVARAKCAEWGMSAFLAGTNCDDLGDYRPGLDAAKEAGALAPLVECGFSKADVRAASESIGLPIWDKPASACLSSRIPYGTSVTRERLTQVGGFEADLKALGFRQVRVRYHDKLARVELDLSELERAVDPETRTAIVAAGKRNGFQYVTLDLAGYRMGSHNEILAGNALRVV
jgi:uncharacterized protein